MACRKFDIEAIKNYYEDMFELSLNFQTVQSNRISNYLEACHVNKAPEIDNISCRCLKDDVMCRY